MNSRADWRYPESRILIFAKAPQPGHVKTRLAATIGDQEAARVYTQWLETMVVQLTAARLAPLQLWASPDTQHPALRRLAQSCGVELHTQPTGDLGQRMHQVMLHTLAWHKQAVLIGSDCPVMQADYVERALRAMEQGINTVLGPAEDGGYVLLGLRQVVPALFEDIPWSTGQVMQVTRRQLLAAHRFWAELETLWDVDRVDDYRRWQRLSGRQMQHLPDHSSQEVNSL